jgi:hypothetical protein
MNGGYEHGDDLHMIPHGNIHPGEQYNTAQFLEDTLLL